MGSAISTRSARLATLVASALAVETVRAAALDVTAADHEIEFTTLEQREHFRQLRFVMLQIGVDHSRARRARGQNALDAGAGQAAPSDPADAADPAVLARERTQDFPGTVGGIVVDKNGLKRDCGQRPFQPPEQRDHIVPLIEGRDNDRKLRKANGLCWVPRSRLRSVIHDASVYPIAGWEPREGPKTTLSGSKHPPEMPTTTNRWRAYIRRSRAIEWSSQRRSYEASTSPLEVK